MCLANLAAGLVLLDRSAEDSGVSNSSHHNDIIDADHMVGVSDLEMVDAPLTLPPSRSFLDNLFSLVPVLSCIFICFGYACGLGPVPWILFGELFPSNIQHCTNTHTLVYILPGSVRGSASSITAFLRSITVFLSIKVKYNN